MTEVVVRMSRLFSVVMLLVTNVQSTRLRIDAEKRPIVGLRSADVLPSVAPIARSMDREPIEIRRPHSIGGINAGVAFVDEVRRAVGAVADRRIVGKILARIQALR